VLSVMGMAVADVGVVELQLAVNTKIQKEYIMF
jgi:hypothetical protein